MKRRHSPSPPAPAARRLPSSYAASSAFPPDKPLPLSHGIGLGHPSSLPPSSLPPSTYSSPHRFAYRDPEGSDTESDSGASDDEIEMSLASIPRWAADVSGGVSGVTDTLVDRKGKGVDPRERGEPSSLDVARERAARRHMAGKFRGDLGRRSRSRVPSSVRIKSRVVSPTESIYVMTQGMSSLQTSPTAIAEESDEQVVSSALENDRRSSSPSPVPQSPSESESPTITRKRISTSRIAFAKAKKRRDETSRPSTSILAAWDAHQEDVDYETLKMMAARIGCKLSPMSPRSRQAAANLESAGTDRGADADVDADEAGPSHKRVRESDDEPESPVTPGVVERMITPKRKQVRVEVAPVQVQSRATPKTPARRAPSEEVHTPKARKALRTVLARTPSTPLPPSSFDIPPGSEDVIEDAVLATASEDESTEPVEEPTPTKPKRKALRIPITLKRPENARQRYAQAIPKANRLPVPRRLKHQAAPSRPRGRDTRQLHRSSPTSLLPARERRVPRLRLARRPVALQRPRRPLFWATQDDEPCAVSGATFTRALRSHQATERARRALLQRYRQRSSYSSLSLLAPAASSPTHKRRMSDPPDADDLAVDELLHDVEMRDSEAVEAVDIALNAQLVGRKRPALPLDAGAARCASRSALRRGEVGEHEEAMRSRAVSRQHELDPAHADERKHARAERHLAARNAAEARREEEAEADVDNALVAPEADIEVTVAREVAPVAIEDIPAASAVPEDNVAVVSEPAPVPEAVETTEVQHVQPRSSEVVEDLLSFDIPPPVQALEELSQPAFSASAPAPPVQHSVDAVEDLAPAEAESSIPISAPPAPLRSDRTAASRHRRHRHPDRIEGPRLGLARRIVSFERRRATTAPPEHRPEGGPSRLRDSTPGPADPPDSPTPARGMDLPLARASSPGPSTAGPSTSGVEAILSPPPRYEFPFYPVIRAAPRAVRPAPRTPTPPPSRARASSDPPRYAPNRYTRSSPSPPPPYNAMTDCSTVVPPVFLPEPTGLGLDFGPAPARPRAEVVGDGEGSVSGSDDEVLAPGTWPRERRQWRPSAAPYRPAPPPQADEDEDEDEMTDEDERPGRIEALGRWLGIWR